MRPNWSAIWPGPEVRSNSPPVRALCSLTRSHLRGRLDRIGITTRSLPEFHFQDV
jgi:hypothetical protein